MTELIKVLDDLNRGTYERTMLNNIKNSQKEFSPGQGEMIFQDNIIRFEKVPLVTPNGDVLVKELTFEVRYIMTNFCLPFCLPISFLI